MARIPVTGLLVLILGMVLAACSAVIIQHPAGEPVSNDVGKQVGGWWVARGEKEGEVQCFLVQPLADGAIRVATLELNPKSSKPEVQELAGLLTEFEGAIYLNLVSGETAPGQSPRYFLLRMHRVEGPAIVLWRARVSAFADAVGKGELAGVTEGEEVKIAASKAELGAFLKSHKPEQVFVIEEPLVFKRP